MKKLICIFCLVASAVAFSQQTDWRKGVWFDPIARPYVYYPLAIGDNILAKAHNETFGAGVNMSFVSLHDFHLGLNYHYTQYRVTDRALAGNFSASNYWALGPFVSYEIPVHNFVSIWPEAGVAYTKVKQKYHDTRVSNQEGTEFRLGLMADYKFSRNASVFVGVNYLMSNMNISANREIEDYYGKFRQMQFTFGIQFEGRPKRPKSLFEDKQPAEN